MARDATIAYVLLRNAYFGPRLASSVELCVRDLVRYSRHSASALVVAPRIGAPFEGIEVVPVPDVRTGGNLAKAWAVGRLLRRRGADVAIVENHLPAAAVIAAASGLPTILHSHAYEKAPSNALKAFERDAELGRLAGLAFVSEDCKARFRANFPKARLPMRAVPNGLDMTAWSDREPKERMILSVGRGLDDKGHIEAMQALSRVLPSRPDWSARFILSLADREPETVARLEAMAGALAGRVRIDRSLPYDEVRTAWEHAAIGMVLTKTPEPFGRTALEALATGTAVVSSGLGGLAEVTGPDAVFVSPTDADAVASALAALMDDPDRRAALARAGRARAERLYDIRAVAGRMDDFVGETIAGR